jgi:hypothetical protein
MSKLSLLVVGFSLGMAPAGMAQNAGGADGGARLSGPVSILDGGQRERLRAFIATENRASTRFNTDLRVGTLLPEDGIGYYAVPAQYGARGYRYTIVNDRRMLVEPNIHRVVEFID